MHCLVFTDTDLYSLTKGKSYLAKQKWRRSTCLRDQCYDVGCHPCSILYLYISDLPVITTAGNDVITARAGDNVRFLFHMTSRPAPFLLELLKEGHRVNESLYRFDNHSHSNTIDVVLSNVTR